MDFFTADICDEHFDKVIALNPNFTNYGGATKCRGEVVTIRLDKTNTDLVKLLRDEDGKGKVVIVDVREEYYAVIGENLMKFAHKNNYSAIIVNGYIRDTEQIKGIPVGLWALGTCPHKYIPTTEGERDVKLTFGGASFETGTYVYADSDGIIVTGGPLV